MTDKTKQATVADLKVFKPAAVARVATHLGGTEAEALKFLLDLEASKPAHRTPFTKVARSPTVAYTGDGLKHKAYRVNYYNGAPELDMSEGHEVDANWFYPVIRSKLPGINPEDVISQADWVQLRKRRKAKLRKVQYPARKVVKEAAAAEALQRG